MTDEEIRKSIRLGEDSAMEFKSIQVTPSRVISPDARVVADERCQLDTQGGRYNPSSREPQ